MEDMDELDIPAAGMYKLGEEIVQGSEKLKVLEISGKGPGGWARTLTRESGLKISMSLAWAISGISSER